MLMDEGMKLPPLPVTVSSVAEFGNPASAALVRGIAIFALFCTALYEIARTKVLGAVLLTVTWSHRGDARVHR
jgi:hypothetical protein